MLNIKRVVTQKELKNFIDFPHKLYNSDINYVPELYVSQRWLLNKQKNPFFKHSQADYFIATQNNKTVGRIAAIQNNNYIEFTGEKVGFFGFFDVIDDYKVAEALFDTAKQWLCERGLTKMLGPENFSTNDTCGMLIEGFDTPPCIMMTHNTRYMPEFADQYGFRKKMDLFAYWIDRSKVPEKINTFSKKLEERLKTKGIVIRPINMKDFDNEIIKIKSIYNSAWEKNWGFVPMTEEEFDHLGKDLKMIADPDFVYLAEHDGKPVGFACTIPNMNQALIKIKNGRLFPFGLLKLLYFKRKIDTVMVLTLGIIESYRKLGIEACFYAKGIETSIKKGIKGGEASWILESNTLMNRALQNLNAVVYKTYRIYELNIV